MWSVVNNKTKKYHTSEIRPDIFKDGGSQRRTDCVPIFCSFLLGVIKLNLYYFIAKWKL